MASQEELRNVRIEKKSMLQEAGMEAYAPYLKRSTKLSDLARDFNEGTEHSVIGRVMAIRGGGAIVFIVINDGTGEFQVVLKKDAIDETLFSLFNDTVDVGDFVWFSGSTFVTKRGAQSLLAAQWKMATKSLLPLPDKHAGLKDQDEIYRKRYLDLITNKEAFKRFTLRSKIIAAIRSFLHDRDFIEIETPILQNQAGGAMAETFNTHHNDYDMDMVLRISLELEHKMVMAGGYPRIFEIGKNFRNEGSDPTHIQEFTMIEWYAAYESLETNMAWTKEMIQEVAQKVCGKEIFTVYDNDGNQHEIDLSADWKQVRFDELLKTYADLDIHTASDDEIKAKAHEYGVPKEEQEARSRASLLDAIYKKSARSKLIQPTFVTHYPSALKPLAQQNEEGTAQVAQLVIACAEITNQYAELVDPLIQRKLLEQQAQAKQDGDQEAMSVDESFLTAMEHGMPPMTGFGMGIDRLVAILTEQRNLRDVIFFPIMKPKNE
jgi:lysyl-tRNA synthetase class 2